MAHPQRALLGVLSEGNPFSLLLQADLKLGLSPRSLPELCPARHPIDSGPGKLPSVAVGLPHHCALGCQSLTLVTMSKPDYDL